MLPTPTTQDLLNQVLNKDNLTQAWKRVRANRGAPGIDGLTIDDFRAHFKSIGPGLIEAIREGRYQPYPVKRVYIEKEGGGWRGLGIPTVFDRLIQQAIVQVFTPIFDPDFSEHSYGFRPKHSQHQAVRKVQSYIAEGRKTAVDVDLSKFFGRFLLPAKPAFPPSLAVADFRSCKTGIPAFPGGCRFSLLQNRHSRLPWRLPSKS